MTGEEFTASAKVRCRFCGGGGVMRETKMLTFTPIEDGEEGEPVEQMANIGDRCPICAGSGETFTTGRRLDG